MTQAGAFDEDWRNAGFGLYLHWPFCQSKCPYCDFNSHVAARIDSARWKQAYLAEIDRIGAETQGRVLNTVFFGGGTPSLMEPDLVAAIIERIRKTWPMGNDPEITLEANPGSVEAGRFRGFRDAGVTRVSMGVQALNDEDLRRLGRLHSVQEARVAFDIARTTFDRVSFDLIYARQGQTVEAWRAELNEALSMAVDHLSLYQLTIEPGTAFFDRQMRGGLRDLPDEDAAADMYEATQEICAKAGMNAYEVSNHARMGAESRHNLIYWRYGDWAGIGPGAHGRLTLDGKRMATEAARNPNEWLRSVEDAGSGELDREMLSGGDQADEYMLMSLRLGEGMDLRRHRLMGGHINDSTVNRLISINLVEVRDERMNTTPRGRLVLNAILRELAEA